MSKDDDWAFKPWGAEKKQNSVFDPVDSHSDFGQSPSASWAFDSSGTNSQESSSYWGFSNESQKSSYWGYDNNNNSSSNFHSNPVGTQSRSFAFGTPTSSGAAGGSGSAWSNPFSASCDSHFLDLKSRERGHSANYNSSESWAFSNVNSLNEVRGTIGHYENRRNGSHGHFAKAENKSWGFDSGPSFNPFSSDYMKKKGDC
jgi:hypothetical protein